MQGSVHPVSIRTIVAVATIVMLLSGCLLQDEFVDSDSSLTISGAPVVEINANQSYSFVPSVSGSDEQLSFSVTGLPVWASFDVGTGQLSGTPGDGDVGTYDGIEITVSNGAESATLGPFTISVVATSPGSVVLEWDAPTENSDGTALTDLAGYKLYWGTASGSYPNSVRIDNPSVLTYLVENLAPGTYRFVATSLNAAGVESEFSNTVTKEVL